MPKILWSYALVSDIPDHFHIVLKFRLKIIYWASDHSVLLSETFILLKKSDLCKLRTCYYKYCKYMLYLHLSYRNWRIIRKYKAPDITAKLQELHYKLSTQAYRRLTPYHGLIRLFCWPFSSLILLYLLYCTFVLIRLFCWFCCTYVLFSFLGLFSFLMFILFPLFLIHYPHTVLCSGLEIIYYYYYYFQFFQEWWRN